MRANPGGQLAGDHVIGRDDLIERLWRDIEGAGLILTGERRLGKTCVVKKMHAAPPRATLAFYQDLEGCHSAAEFVAEVLNAVRDRLSTTERARNGVRELWQALGGTEVQGVVTIPATTTGDWAALLRRVIGDLMEAHGGTARVVFFWDELPQMLHNVALHRPHDAMALLDVLRSLRQHHPRLRMVYTGSVGLPAVLARLQRQGYGNAPVNDLLVVTVPPLDASHATELASRLLRGERVEIREQGADGAAQAGPRAGTRPPSEGARLAEVARAIAHELADAAEGVPYYIHHLVRSVAQDPGHLAPGEVAAHVRRALADPHDPWQLRHYRTRLERDYEPADVAVALAALDALACATEPIPLPALRRLLSATAAAPDAEALRRVLGLLEQDHYLRREPEARGWTFRLRLLARWWRESRDLT